MGWFVLFSILFPYLCRLTTTGPAIHRSYSLKLIGSRFFTLAQKAALSTLRGSRDPVRSRCCPASCALWKSLRNYPRQGSDREPEVTGLKSESVTGFIPES